MARVVLSRRTRAQAHTTNLSHFLLFLLTPFLFFSPPCKKKKKKFTLGIKLSSRIGKLMLVSLNKGCAKQKSFPWGKDLQVMPSLHRLFLFQAVEINGTMRPWSLTESYGIITVYIIYLYNKVEVTNASFSHSVLVSHIYSLKSLSFSRVALNLLGRKVEWQTSTVFKGCHEYWAPKRAIAIVIGLNIWSNRVKINSLLYTGQKVGDLIVSSWLTLWKASREIRRSHVANASSLKHVRSKAWNQVFPAFPFKI